MSDQPYNVGYGRPPLHSRFEKGRSGNPAGRPRGLSTGRATALAVAEFFRQITLREGEKTRKVPALQAVMRSQIALAIKGNQAAQRALVQTAFAIEKAVACQNAAEKVNGPTKMSELEAVRRVAAALLKYGGPSPGEPNES
jgi:hypothetical protein